MTIAVSWGRYGGFYCHSGRLCLGWVAITLLHVEVDDLMHAYVEQHQDRQRLRETQTALRCIIDNYGGVCETYEACQHRSCHDSYGAWAVADEAWRASVTPWPKKQL